MKIFKVLFPLLCVVFLTGVSFNSKGLKSHQKWSSLIMQLGDERIFRAVTTDMSNPSTVLAIDSFQNACDSYRIQMIYTLDEYNAEANTIKGDGALIRVDTKPVHSAEFSITTEVGDDSAFAVMSNVENGPVLYREMLYGNVIRFKLTLGESYFLNKFSLRGSMAALKRVSALCKKYSSRDEDYFSSPPKQKPKRNKSDDEYFL